MNLRRNLRGWLLWLALLLPIAQAMAGVHALSHIGEGGGDSLVHRVDCDLCFTAAQLAGAAPTAEPAALPVGHATEVRLPAPRPTAIVCDAGWRPPARAPPASA